MEQVKNYKILLTFFLCIGLTSSCASRNKKIRKKADLRHQMALSYMKKCEYPLALKELKKAIKLKNKNPMLHYSIALLYFQFKKYNLTIKHLKQSLKLNPKFTEARVHLAQVLIEQGQLKNGSKELDKTRKDLTYRYPEKIHSYQGIIYYKQKKYALAEKQFSVARTVHKKNCSASLYHAKSLYFQNKFTEATNILESTKRWCKKNETSSCSTPSYEAYYFSALAHDKIGKKQQALLDLGVFLNKTKESPYLQEAEKLLTKWRGLN